jgi:folate-dependent tRNA-U54 methylase TrmFO/GidA
MKANFGLLPPLAEQILSKRGRGAAFANRAAVDLEAISAQLLGTLLTG